MSTVATNLAARLLKLKMYSRLIFRISFVVLALQFVTICVVNGWFNPSWEATKEIFGQGAILGFKFIKGLHFKEAFSSWDASLNFYWASQKSIILKSFVCWLLLPMIMIYISISDKDDVSKREYIQGKRYFPPVEFNNTLYQTMIEHKFYQVRYFQLKKLIPLGEVYLPYKEESKHALACGKPGCGKTNTFNQMILKILELKRKLIIHDFKGDYVEKFYNPEHGDLIFNPFDSRSIGWCLFNDCKSIMDIEAFGAALIPNATVGEPFWNNAARDIFVGVLRYCYFNNKRTNKDIWDTVTLRNDILYMILSSTDGCEIAAKYLEDPEGKTAIGVMANMMQFVKIFEYMQEMKGEFSIREWVSSESSNTIFITNYANLQNTLRPMISLFIQTVGSSLLSLSDDIHRRLYFILDEFGQLPKMDTVTSLMTASRSKGGSVWIGIQDVGQLDTIYTEKTRGTILNACSNRLIFNCQDQRTAKILSDDIGQTEYWEATENLSLGVEKGDRINVNKQRRKEPLVTTEDIQSLRELSAFITIGGSDVTLSKWKYKKLPKIADAFIQRPELNLEYIMDIKNVVNNEKPDELANAKQVEPQSSEPSKPQEVKNKEEAQVADDKSSNTVDQSAADELPPEPDDFNLSGLDSPPSNTVKKGTL